MFNKTKLVIIALLPLTSLAAPMPDYMFKSPAFNGVGYSSHVLTIENQEYTRQKAWRDQVQAALDKAAADKQNSNLQKFLNNLESRIYAQISQNLAASMFANSGSCSTSSSSYSAPCGSFDFEGNNILIELKSRRCNSFTYPTTIIGINKFKNIDPNKKYILLFSFTDFVLYIEYDEPLFNTFEIKTITRRDRGRIESSKYFHIPIQLLNPILYEYN